MTEAVSWGVLYYSLSVFVTPMADDLGWSRAAISGGLSVALVVSGLAGLPAGRWLDEHGPRALMTLGSVVAVLLVLAWSRVADLGVFYGLWAAIGLCMSATLYGPAFATVVVWFRRDRARALTAITLMAGLASTIFVPLAAWLVHAQGWRPSLVALALLLGAVTIPLHALVLRRRPSDLGLAVDGDAREPEESGGVAVLGFSLREAMRHQTFPWLALAMSCSALVTGVQIHLVALLGDRGFPIAFAAAAAGAVGVAQLVGRIAFAPAERRLAARHLSVGIYLTQPLALLVLLLVPSVVGVAVFVAVFGAGRGAETLLRATLPAALYGPRRFASISGVLSLLVTVSVAASPVGLGAAYDLTGGYAPALWALVAVTALGAFAIWRADRRDGMAPAPVA